MSQMTYLKFGTLNIPIAEAEIQPLITHSPRERDILRKTYLEARDHALRACGALLLAWEMECGSPHRKPEDAQFLLSRALENAHIAEENLEKANKL